MAFETGAQFPLHTDLNSSNTSGDAFRHVSPLWLGIYREFFTVLRRYPGSWREVRGIFYIGPSTGYSLLCVVYIRHTTKEPLKNWDGY